MHIYTLAFQLAALEKAAAAKKEALVQTYIYTYMHPYFHIIYTHIYIYRHFN
jgi:hypothetical protein